MSVVWLAESAEHDRVLFRIGRDGDQLRAEWVGVGTLNVNRDGTGMNFRTEPGADPALIAKLETGTMRALLRHLRRELTLHASAVAARGGAVAFVGDSGSGKSTLAFALATSDAQAFELLSDDCLCIDADLAAPSETMGWLDEVARSALHLVASSGKSPARPKRLARGPVPLRTIVHLVFADDFGVRPLRGSAAAAVLGRAMIRFVLDEPEIHRADMNRIAELVQRLEVVELARPKGVEHLDRTASRIEELTAAW